LFSYIPDLRREEMKNQIIILKKDEKAVVIVHGLVPMNVLLLEIR